MPFDRLFASPREHPLHRLLPFLHRPREVWFQLQGGDHDKQFSRDTKWRPHAAHRSLLEPHESLAPKPPPIRR
ncbi:hypothetical protein ILUMI_27051 [Ignelater luminosus]|uniref:Uncharacterized protein n=1 Tax=Ignelater luminosus TaxID=2038154 RepID=A0A8K0FY32_IGNLU|nr:hypothetical protein ILUMI_27051 [Ignelater luminosus]